MRSLLVALLLTILAGISQAKPAADTTTAQVRKLVAVIESDASQKAKADACRELARIGNKEAVAPLAELLPDYYLSHMARYGLETIPDSSVDKALRRAATRLHGRLLIGVIGSIGVRRDPRAVALYGVVLALCSVSFVLLRYAIIHQHRDNPDLARYHRRYLYF